MEPLQLCCATAALVKHAWPWKVWKRERLCRGKEGAHINQSQVSPRMPPGETKTPACILIKICQVPLCILSRSDGWNGCEF